MHVKFYWDKRQSRVCDSNKAARYLLKDVVDGICVFTLELALLCELMAVSKISSSFFEIL